MNTLWDFLTACASRLFVAEKHTWEAQKLAVIMKDEDLVKEIYEIKKNFLL